MSAEREVREIDLPDLGSVVAGKYELVGIIGKGGMGIVYEAKHLRLNKRVAIKMLRPAALHVSEFKPRFEREARTAALLRGHHVARIFDVDTTESGLPFMVMEYLVGKDLDLELRERGTISVMEATGYVLQACVAMQEAHAAGIVHRDLKPANLFLTDESGERVVKVLDFGISKLTHEVDTHLTGTFATVGTPLYMSPEQVRSSRNVDARSDVWSLAVILFEALAGQPPFHGSMTATAAAIVADKTPSLRGFRPDVPIELEEVLERALEKHPNRRYQDVAELAAALAPFGPARIPFAELSSPISLPSPSSRIVPPGSSPNGGFERGAAADTILIPAEERGESIRPRRKRNLPLVLAGLALLVGIGGASMLMRPTASMPSTPATRQAPPTEPRVAAMPAPDPTQVAAVVPHADETSSPAASGVPEPVVPSASSAKVHSPPAASYAAPGRLVVASAHTAAPASAAPRPPPRPPPTAANPIFLQ